MEVLKEFKNVDGEVYCRIEGDLSNKLIKDTWIGSFGKQENFRTALEFIGSQVKEKGYNRWLADLRELQASFDGSSDWVTTEFMPKVIADGLIAEAIVFPRQIFAKLSLKDSYKKFGPLEIRTFGDYTEGYEWVTAPNPHDVAVKGA